jgi:hypothetical protein
MGWGGGWMRKGFVWKESVVGIVICFSKKKYCQSVIGGSIERTTFDLDNNLTEQRGVYTL